MKKILLALTVLTLFLTLPPGTANAQYTRIEANPTVKNIGTTPFTKHYSRKDTIVLALGTTQVDTTGTIDTIYVKEPTQPKEGGLYWLCTKSALTVVIFVSGSGTINNKITTLAAGSCAAYRYQRSNTTYYRRQ